MSSEGDPAQLGTASGRRQGGADNCNSSCCHISVIWPVLWQRKYCIDRECFPRASYRVVVIFALYSRPAITLIDSDIDGYELEILWHDWVRNEEIVRAAHGLFIMDAELGGTLHRELI